MHQPTKGRPDARISVVLMKSQPNRSKSGYRNRSLSNASARLINRQERRTQGGPMRINLASVLVDDQERALAFYTDVLGFVKKTDLPAGEHRWLTVVSPDAPDGTELLLEPDAHPAAKPFKDALVSDGIPYTSFAVDDVRAEYDRLTGLGVRFTQEPLEMGPITSAVLDDTCGNLIQIASMSAG
jgi:catechol 2,3-dioxygenase-like lactoylglutathione lyase family enzyme